jgi:hypothetical protein
MLFHHRLTFKCRSRGSSCTVLWLSLYRRHKVLQIRCQSAPEGEEPNLEEALDAVKRAAGYDRITILDVWTDAGETDVNFMVAVASATRETASAGHITGLSAQQLNIIARAARLEGVSPRWMRATYLSYELKEMNVPEL